MIPKYQCLQCITRLKLLSYNHDIGLKNMCKYASLLVVSTHKESVKGESFKLKLNIFYPYIEHVLN